MLRVFFFHNIDFRRNKSDSHFPSKVFLDETYVDMETKEEEKSNEDKLIKQVDESKRIKSLAKLYFKGKE
uniref:Uncharacterized protein n=1 Tax=Rhizophora mucronata TaxID=61149 RepID=A0A2P2J0I5_RHIMU